MPGQSLKRRDCRSLVLDVEVAAFESYLQRLGALQTVYRAQPAGAIWAVSLIGAVSTLGFLVLLDKSMKRVRARKAAEGELG